MPWVRHISPTPQASSLRHAQDWPGRWIPRPISSGTSLSLGSLVTPSHPLLLRDPSYLTAASKNSFKDKEVI